MTITGGQSDFCVFPEFRGSYPYCFLKNPVEAPDALETAGICCGCYGDIFVHQQFFGVVHSVIVDELLESDADKAVEAAGDIMRLIPQCRRNRIERDVFREVVGYINQQFMYHIVRFLLGFDQFDTGEIPVADGIQEGKHGKLAFYIRRNGVAAGVLRVGHQPLDEIGAGMMLFERNNLGAERKYIIGKYEIPGLSVYGKFRRASNFSAQSLAETFHKIAGKDINKQLGILIRAERMNLVGERESHAAFLQTDGLAVQRVGDLTFHHIDKFKRPVEMDGLVGIAEDMNTDIVIIAPCGIECLIFNHVSFHLRQFGFLGIPIRFPDETVASMCIMT